jgi:hypothetical protein
MPPRTEAERARDAVEVAVDAAIDAADFVGALALVRDPCRHRDENDCCLLGHVARALSVACEPLHDDEAPPAVEARRAGVVAAGALAFAVEVINAERGGCPSACDAACKLLHAALARGDAAAVAAADAAGASHAVLQLLDAVRDDSLPWMGLTTSCMRIRRGVLDTLLALAGIDSMAPPHVGIAARAAAHGASAAGAAAADSVLLTACAAPWHAHEACMDLAVAWCAAPKAPGWARPDLDGLATSIVCLAGRTLRALLAATLANKPAPVGAALLRHVVGVLSRHASDAQVQWWGMNYVFLPLAYREVSGRAPVSSHAASPHARHYLCRLRCCAPRGATGAADATRALLDATGALPLVCAAVRNHGSCGRPGARLLELLCRGSAPGVALLARHGGEAALRLRGRGRSRAALSNVAALSAAAAARASSAQQDEACEDEGEVGASDGDSLSECGNGAPSAAKVTTHILVERALRAVAPVDAASVAAAAALQSARAAAADAAAAALLAEEEAVPAGAKARGGGVAAKQSNAKSKKKKSKAAAPRAKQQVAAEEEEDEEADEEEGSSGAGGGGAAEEDEEVAMARLLSAGRGAAAGKQAAPGKRSGAAAPAAALALPPPPAPRAVRSTPPARAPRAVPFGGAGARVCPCGDASCSAELAHAPPHAADAAPLTSEAQLAALFPWMALRDEPLPAPTPQQPQDEAHEDDGLCICCLDAPRDTALPGCAGAHPPAVCGGCAALLLSAAAPACPLCRAPA